MLKWLTVGDIAVAMLPKVASTSMMEMYQDGMLPGAKTGGNEMAMECRRRVMWVREPMDRLTSVYSWLHWSEMEDIAPADRWEDFIDYILHHDNEHWEPQKHSLTLDSGEFVPTEVHCFESLHETWPLPGPLPWLRAVRREPVDLSYRNDLLNDKYEEDRVLWLSAAH